MSRKDEEYYDKFQDSHWVAKGGDPRSEERVREEFDEKYEKVSGSVPKTKKFKEFLENLSLLYKYLLGGDDISAKVLIVAALLYFVSPIDLVPDFIPVAGYLDDAAVVAGVVALLASVLANFGKRLKESRAKEEGKAIGAPEETGGAEER